MATERQKQYYQNNKDKFKPRYKIVHYCELCMVEFLNITRHKQNKSHKFLVENTPWIVGKKYMYIIRRDPI